MLLLLTLGLASCRTSGDAGTPAGTASSAYDPDRANVLSVEVSGKPGAYVFAVEVRSPDTGCERYADWWEVVAPDGRLVHRRILDHSHVDEQPFVRSGDPMELGADDEVVVRAHLHPDGYGGQALRGTAGGGFGPDPAIGADWHAELASEPPLPTGCLF